MATLTLAEIRHLLAPYVTEPPEALIEKLSLYLDLLLRWNLRTNLTAIRDPAEIVTRHFGESLFAASHLGEAATLLDYGTGAGFPGLPIALIRPGVQVTLAESQNKKVAFLREAVRTLEISVDVWPRRTEEMPAGTSFDCVSLRAVDSMPSAVHAAQGFARRSILLLTTNTGLEQILILSHFQALPVIPVPGAGDRILARFTRG